MSGKGVDNDEAGTGGQSNFWDEREGSGKKGKGVLRERLTERKKRVPRALIPYKKKTLLMWGGL